jgi:quercetin dioxygenase-like cupin family protein
VRRKNVTDAIVYHGSGEGRALEVGGDLVLIKASRDQGFGSLFVELTCPPGGGPPPHTDPSEELFYVLEGEFEFVSPGPEGLAARPLQVGDSVCVPRGAPHAFRNVGRQPGRLLVFFPQNERMQGFFEELGNPVPEPSTWTSSGPPPLERAIAAAKRWGIGFAAPPPGQ